MKHYLDGPWSLTYTCPDKGETVRLNINVPGNVETALFENGITGDFMPADDLYSHEKYDWVDDWTFERSFTAPKVSSRERLTLNFEGIDTVAEIYLNGEQIYFADNMHVKHVIDVTDKVMSGENNLRVVIRSALLAAGEYEEDMFSQPRLYANTHKLYYGGQSHLRKARHEWGWDNAPRLLTAGIYRSVYLETLPAERFDDVYVYTKRVTNESVSMGITWRFVTDSRSLYGYKVRITVSQNGKVLESNEDKALFFIGIRLFHFSRDKVKLWWPRGYGEQSFVDVKLELIRGEETVAEQSLRYGLRTLKLEYTDCIDENNNGEFVFICNGEKIYINGTNWKPLDPLHSKADAKVTRALELAYDLNCNMIRIWGGGIYEDTPFFDYCDEKGILVWQDFMLGCEVPPNDEKYLERIYKESEQIIKKLRNHPSLAVWCGDNENDMSLSWGTYFGSNILPSHIKVSRRTLPDCVIANDPYRSYVPSSAYLSDEVFIRNSAGDFSISPPEVHLYPKPLDYAKALRSCKSRFIGETGPIGMNPMTDNPRIFEREKERAKRLWDAPRAGGVDAHQADDYFINWRQTGKETCLKYYGRDFSFDEIEDYYTAENVICADVFKEVIEYCRTERPNKTGVIWWSMLDMWPMLFNFSVVDCDFVKKLPYYWIRQSQQSLLLCIVRKELDGDIALYTANNTLSEKKGEYKITAITESGEAREVTSGSYVAEKNASALVGKLPESEKPELLIIEWKDGDGVHYNHFITGKKPYNFEAVKMWSDRLLELYRG